MTPKRACCLCQKTQPLTTRWFERASGSKTGFSYECKMCGSIRNRIGYRKRRIASAKSRTEDLQSVIDKHIAWTLRTLNGNVDEAADALGIGRASIYRWLKRRNETPKDFVSPDFAELAALEQEWKGLHDRRTLRRISCHQAISDQQLARAAADYFDETTGEPWRSASLFRKPRR